MTDPVRRAMAAAVVLCLGAVALAPAASASVSKPDPVPSRFALATAGGAKATIVRSVTASTRSWRASAPATLTLGRSHVGRSIVARRQGSAAAPYVVLVIGQMHGDEPGGRAVVAALQGLAAPGGVQLWSIGTMNPDGARAGTRPNSRGVDLNRNFPNLWRPSYTAPAYFPGRRAGSEPETRAAMLFLDRLRPDLVVSLHQAYRAVDIGNPKTSRWAVRIARAFGLPTAQVPCRGPCAGTLTSWYNAAFTGMAVTVELPARVPVALARAYARSSIRVAAQLVPRPAVPVAPPLVVVSPPAPVPAPTDTPTPQPPVVESPSASASPTPTDTPSASAPSTPAP